jgi:hypothetical protein
MVKFDVLFEVRTEFLNVIYTGVGFKDLNFWLVTPCGHVGRLDTTFWRNILSLSLTF